MSRIWVDGNHGTVSRWVLWMDGVRVFSLSLHPTYRRTYDLQDAQVHSSQASDLQMKMQIMELELETLRKELQDKVL